LRGKKKNFLVGKKRGDVKNNPDKTLTLITQKGGRRTK